MSFYCTQEDFLGVLISGCGTRCNVPVEMNLPGLGATTTNTFLCNFYLFIFFAVFAFVCVCVSPGKI